jgi:hypothetical protein
MVCELAWLSASSDHHLDVTKIVDQGDYPSTEAKRRGFAMVVVVGGDRAPARRKMRGLRLTQVESVRVVKKKVRVSEVVQQFDELVSS